MSAIPTWQAPTAGMSGQARAVNQLLGAHNAQLLYGPGTVQASQTTASTSYTSTSSLWISQKIVTGSSQTTIGQVLLQISDVGGSPTLPLIAPLTVSLYADSGGLPTGSALASATVSNEFVYTSGYWVTIPLIATGLTSTTIYHLATAPVGTSSHYYAWHQSNQTSGATTSPDGVTWTNQAYSMTYQVADQTGTTVYPTRVVEENGARWTALTYDSANRLTNITEFTGGQTSTGYLYSSRSITYSGGTITGVN